MPVAPSSFLFLVVRPGAPSSFLLLLVRHLLLEAMHLLLASLLLVIGTLKKHVNPSLGGDRVEASESTPSPAPFVK